MQKIYKTVINSSIFLEQDSEFEILEGKVLIINAPIIPGPKCTLISFIGGTVYATSKAKLEARHCDVLFSLENCVMQGATLICKNITNSGNLACQSNYKELMQNELLTEYAHRQTLSSKVKTLESRIYKPRPLFGPLPPKDHPKYALEKKRFNEFSVG